jgi:hypothetical protein
VYKCFNNEKNRNKNNLLFMFASTMHATRVRKKKI